MVTNVNTIDSKIPSNIGSVSESITDLSNATTLNINVTETENKTGYQ